jgi:hypothetical protein
LLTAGGTFVADIGDEDRCRSCDMVWRWEGRKCKPPIPNAQRVTLYEPRHRFEEWVARDGWLRWSRAEGDFDGNDTEQEVREDEWSMELQGREEVKYRPIRLLLHERRLRIRPRRPALTPMSRPPLVALPAARS